MKRLIPLMIFISCLAFTASISAQCDSNELMLKMYDTYGDGWTGNELTIYTLNDNCVQSVAAGPFELGSGEYGFEDLCLPDGCYSILSTAGTYVHEISWELVRKSDNTMLSSGANVQNVIMVSIGATADCSFIGCTDPESENYDPAATCSFDVCEYSAPANDVACGAISLDCGISGMYGTTQGATDGGVNPCKGFGVEDVWYKMTGTGNTIKATVTGLADTTNMQINVLIPFGDDCDSPMVCNSLTYFIKEDVNTKSAQWDSDYGQVYYLNVGSKDLIPNSEFNLSTTCLGCDNGVTLSADYVGTERALMSWTSMTSELSTEHVWLCPQGAPAGDASCTLLSNVTSPLNINDLKACTDYDVYLEQTCNSNEVVTTGPVAISMDEHTVNPLPNIGEQLCYPPCHNGIATYASDEEITWTLCTEEGMRPAVTFDYVDIESDGECTSDRIEVTGTDYTIFLCGESQGDNDFGNGLADGNCYYADQNGGCITVKFKTNGNTEETGFCFHFEQIAVADDSNCIDFAAANSSVPVQLLSFDAEAETVENIIRWSTGSEINNEWQIIETSLEGRNWTELERVAATRSNTQNEYKVVDTNPSKTTFYRLKTLDYDGYTETFSPVVVQRDRDLSKLSISSLIPNPASDVVSVTMESASSRDIELILVDLTGKIVLEENVINTNDKKSINLDVSNIASGAYLLSLKSNNEIATRKLIISR